MLLEDTVAVSRNELIQTYSSLANQLRFSAGFAEIAVKHQDHLEYIDLRSAYETSRDILSLSMFDCFGEKREKDLKQVFPKWVEMREDPFEEISRQPLVVFSDGEVLEESDVPF